MQSRPFPRSLLFLVVAIALINAVATMDYWYWKMRWFDMPMHFAGGVWIAGAVLWWRFFSEDSAASASRGAIFGWALLGALGVGIGWEAYEAVVSFVTVGHVNDFMDTLSDLGFDALGALLVAGGVLWRNNK